MGRVGIIGAGHGRFGQRSDGTVQELAFEAFRDALQDAGVGPEAIDASVIASVPEYHKQRSLAGVIQEYLNLNPRPTWLTEVACASGSAAIRTAWMAIKSGLHDVVAVIGCQKMTELETAEILALMGRVGEVQWESIFGTTFPGYYAMFAQRHMHEFGTTREQLAAVAIKNHYYGARNDKALFRKEITAEKAMASDPVASPFRVYDCCANADGAACVVLASEERAKEAGDRVVWLDGVGCASASMSVLRRPNLVSLPSAIEASRQAYEMAGITARDVKVADVHDCFTIAEIMVAESIGKYKPGKAGPAFLAGESALDGAFPINPSGGLKSKGHPVGATGIAQIVEIYKQLTGQAENGRQIQGGPKVGMAQNMGGTGASSVVHILEVA